MDYENGFGVTSRFWDQVSKLLPSLALETLSNSRIDLRHRISPPSKQDIVTQYVNITQLKCVLRNDDCDDIEIGQALVGLFLGNILSRPLNI